jgi:hypothetical protein
MTKNPAEETCLVSDEFGVFVSPLGDDAAGNGTKQNPYKTLAKAVGEASSSSKHVFACDDGTGYTETTTLVLGADFDGLGLFGGFDCASWSYSTTQRLSSRAQPPRCASECWRLCASKTDITAGPRLTASSIGVLSLRARRHRCPNEDYRWLRRRRQR